MKCLKIAFSSFRNIASESCSFSDGANLLWGKNAQGKSNILEGIYFFARGRSFRGAREKDMISFGENEAQLSLDFKKDGDSLPVNLSAVLSQTGKKVLTRTGAKLSGTKEMIGNFRAVLFCPAHLTLVSGGPALRRSFMDIALSQLYPAYLDSLSRYNRALHQRNALIKQAQDMPIDSSLWEIYAEQMSALAADIASRRLRYMTELDGYVAELFDSMTSGREVPRLDFSTVLQKEGGGEEEIKGEGRKRLEAMLCDNLKREIAYGSTLYGTHKDDFGVLLDKKEAKLYASQGQQRSLALAMKLAEGEASRRAGGEYPVFLLDDVLSELDEGRRGFILSKLSDRQIIITSCDSDVMEKYLGGVRLIKVDGGRLTDTADYGDRSCE